jgi:hypothetical protein
MSLLYAMTNVFFKYISNQVIDWKGIGVFGKDKGFHSTPSKLLILHRHSEPFSVFGIIFTHILFAKGEKVVQRAYISLKYPFLAIHAEGGQSISPKQKDRTTTNFQNLS